MSETDPLGELEATIAARAAAKAPFMGGRASLAYPQLRDRIARTRGLLARLGVGRGARVLIASEDDAAVGVLYLAALTHGATAVVMDPNATPAEAVVLAARSRPAALFLDDTLIRRTEALSRSVEAPLVAIAPDRPARAGLGFLIRPKATVPATYPALLGDEMAAEPEREAAADDPALMLFTSGTTSKPKAVVVSRGALAAQLEVLVRRFGLDTRSRIVNHLPFHHTDGLNQGPLLAAAAGCEVIRPGAVTIQSLGAILDLVYQRRASHLVTVPTVLAMMARLPSDYDDTFSHPEFRFIESTAGPLDPALWRETEARFAARVVNCYGLTETVSEALYAGPDDASHRIGTVGRPDGFEMRIRDDAGATVGRGKTGELMLRGAGLMSGYFEDPEATAAVLADGWLATGDLAVEDEDGCVRIVGRKKNVIIRASVNIYPEDLDTAARACPGVSAAATIGMPDEMLGERVILCVTARQGATGLQDTLMEHLRETVGAERLPNEIIVLDALPYGPSGKVLLSELRTMASAAGPATAGETLTEAVIAEAAAAFGRRAAELGPESTAESTAGWDSLTFLEFVTRLERRFAVRLAPRDVMAIDRLGDAIAALERTGATATGALQ